MQVPSGFDTPASALASTFSQAWWLAPIIMLSFVVADQTLTYLNIRSLARRYGLRIAASMEQNGILRGSWLKHGLRKGEVIALAIISPVVLLLLGFATAMWVVLPVFYGFMVGTYFWIVSRHVNIIRNIDDFHPCPQCQYVHRQSPFFRIGDGETPETPTRMT
jgi:hypothetical protein